MKRLTRYDVEISGKHRWQMVPRKNGSWVRSDQHEYQTTVLVALLVLLIFVAVLSLIGGCETTPQDTGNHEAMRESLRDHFEDEIAVPEVFGALSVDTIDTIPSQLQVVGWMAHYGLSAVRKEDAPVWTTTYPTENTAAAWVRWRVETVVPADPAEIQHIAGVVASLRILTQPEHRDSLKVWVSMENIEGVSGGWTLPGRWD